jgi:hypothetical protein
VVESHKVCTFCSDFTYRDRAGALVAEDRKSPATITASFRIKAKHFTAIYGIPVTLTGKGITTAQAGRRPRRITA